MLEEREQKCRLSRQPKSQAICQQLIANLWLRSQSHQCTWRAKYCQWNGKMVALRCLLYEARNYT